MADESTTTETVGEQTGTETAAEGQATEQSSETDWKAKYEETLSHSRANEREAKANRKAAAELAALKAKDQTEAERSTTERDAALERAAKATRRAVASEVKVLATGLNFTDPADALRMLDLEDLTGEDGEIKEASVLAALKDIAKKKPYLLAAAGAVRSGVHHSGGTGEGAGRPTSIHDAVSRAAR